MNIIKTYKIPSLNKDKINKLDIVKKQFNGNFDKYIKIEKTKAYLSEIRKDYGHLNDKCIELIIELEKIQGIKH